MPTILTRSAGSARGYGLTGNPTIHRVQQTLQSTTWTAPAGVTSLLTVTGKGQDGVAAFWRDISSVPSSSLLPYWLADVPDTNFSSVDVESFAQSQWDLFPANPGAGTVNMSWECRRYQGYPSLIISETFGPYDIRCTGTKTKVGNGWGSTYPPDPGFRPIYEIGGGIQFFTPQFDGANTTGFGYTFAGGVGAAATPTTYNNVAVTPGTTYTINSTGDGYIIIVYYLQV